MWSKQVRESVFLQCEVLLNFQFNSDLLVEDGRVKQGEAVLMASLTTNTDT